MFSSFHKLHAFGLDFFSRGEGYVREQIENDLTLRDALQQECGAILQYLNNKSRIVFLSTCDAINRKMIQKQSESTIEYTDKVNEGGEIVVGEVSNDSVEGPVAEETVNTEDDTGLEIQGLHC